MAYATRSDLEAAFGAAEIARLADKNRGATMSDAEALIEQNAIIAYALQRAHLRVQALVGNIVADAAGNPDILAMLRAQETDIARWYLMDDAATEQATKRKDDAIQTLKDLRARLLDIGTDGGALPTVDTGSSIVMQASATRWGGGAF